MRAIIAREPQVQVLSDPQTRRVCLSVWVNIGETSVSTDIWLSADRALGIAQQLSDATKSLDAPSATAAVIAAE